MHNLLKRTDAWRLFGWFYIKKKLLNNKKACRTHFFPVIILEFDNGKVLPLTTTCKLLKNNGILK